MDLKPHEIFYSQDSINKYFGRKTSHSHTLIGETLDDICENRCSISYIPTISVSRHKDKWFTKGNRRLWIFRQLERLGKCKTVRVEETNILSQNMTTVNGGTEIKVRNGSPGGKWYNEPTVYVPELTQTEDKISESVVVAAEGSRNDALVPSEGKSFPNSNVLEDWIIKPIEEDSDGKQRSGISAGFSGETESSEIKETESITTLLINDTVSVSKECGSGSMAETSKPHARIPTKKQMKTRNGYCLRANKLLKRSKVYTVSTNVNNIRIKRLRLKAKFAK